MSAARTRDMLAHDTFALPPAAVEGLCAESVRIVKGEALEAACVVARRALRRLDAMGQGSDATVRAEAMRAMRTVFEMIDGEGGDHDVR